MGKKFALIAGIENYRPESGFARVDYAINDCLAMEKYFREVAEFNRVTIIEDEKEATFNNLVIAIDELFQDTDEKDTIAFFFAGHGLLTELGGYLVPYGYNKHERITEATCISYESINRRIRLRQPKSFYMFVDACHSGIAAEEVEIRGNFAPNRYTFEHQKTILNKIANELKGLVTIPRTKSVVKRFVFTSCSPDEKSYPMEETEHGIFTYYLLEGLSELGPSEDGHVDYNSLQGWVSERVSQYALGRSWSQNPKSYHDITGKLLLPIYEHPLILETVYSDDESEENEDAFDGEPVAQYISLEDNFSCVNYYDDVDISNDEITIAKVGATYISYIWSNDIFVDLERFSEVTIEFEAIVVGKQEVIVVISSRVIDELPVSNAVSVATMPDSAAYNHSFASAIRSKLFDVLLADNMKTIRTNAWVAIKLILRKDFICLYADGEKMVSAKTDVGVIPPVAILGFCGYNHPDDRRDGVVRYRNLRVKNNN